RHVVVDSTGDESNNRDGGRGGGGAVVVADGVLEAVVAAEAGGGGVGDLARGRVHRNAAVLRPGDHRDAGGHQVLIAVGVGVVFQHVDRHLLRALGLAEVVCRRRDVDADEGSGDVGHAALIIADG